MVTSFWEFFTIIIIGTLLYRILSDFFRWWYFGDQSIEFFENKIKINCAYRTKIIVYGREHTVKPGANIDVNFIEKHPLDPPVNFHVGRTGSQQERNQQA